MKTKNDAAEQDNDDTLDLGEGTEPNVKIDLRADDPDEDGGGDDPAGEEKPQQQGRDEQGKWTRRKAERGQRRREETNWKTEKAQLEGRIAEMQRQSAAELAALRAELARGQQQVQATRQQPADPYSSRLQEIQQGMDAELKLMEANSNHPYTRYLQLQEAKQELIAERVLWKQQQQAQQRPQQQQQQAGGQYQVRYEILCGEFPFLADPQQNEFRARVGARRRFLIEGEGMPDTIETDRQAVAETLAKWGHAYGLRAPAAPAARTRGLYEAPGMGTRAPRGGSEDDGEIEIPRALAAASGLSAQSLRAALRPNRG